MITGYALLREGVARIDFPRFQAGAQPLDALRRRAVGEGIGHRGSARRFLQAIVADRLGGRDRRFEVAWLEEMLLLFLIGGPDAGETIGHELDPHRQIIRAALIAHARGTLLGRLDFRENAEQVLHMMADFMGDDISIGKVTAAAEAPLHVLKEGRVEINFLIPWAIERPHGGLGAAASRGCAAAIEHELRLDVGNAFLLGQNFRPDRLVGREHGGDELAHVIGGRPRLPRLRRRGLGARAHLVDHFGTADEKARINPERPADEAENDNCPDAKATLAAGNAASLPAPVLDIGRTAEILPFHERPPPSYCLQTAQIPLGFQKEHQKAASQVRPGIPPLRRLTFRSGTSSSRSSAGDAHVPGNRGLRVIAIDDEIMALGLAGDGGVEGFMQEFVGGRRAQRRPQIGRVVLAKAHVKRSGAGHPHPIAAFAKIMGERRDEAETPAGFRDLHITGGSAGPVTGVEQGETLPEARLDKV
jgi:hypothetical protein